MRSPEFVKKASINDFKASSLGSLANYEGKTSSPIDGCQASSGRNSSEASSSEAACDSSTIGGKDSILRPARMPAKLQSELALKGPDSSSQAKSMDREEVPKFKQSPPLVSYGPINSSSAAQRVSLFEDKAIPKSDKSLNKLENCALSLGKNGDIENNSPSAQYELASQLYVEGPTYFSKLLNKPKDLVGTSISRCTLGYFYSNGQHPFIKKNPLIAVTYYIIILEDPTIEDRLKAPICLALGMIMSREFKDYENALLCFSQTINSIDVEDMNESPDYLLARINLAYIYFYGLGVKENRVLAKKLVDKAILNHQIPNQKSYCFNQTDEHLLNIKEMMDNIIEDLDKKQGAYKIIKSYLPEASFIQNLSELLNDRVRRVEMSPLRQDGSRGDVMSPLRSPIMSGPTLSPTRRSNIDKWLSESFLPLGLDSNSHFSDEEYLPKNGETSGLERSNSSYDLRSIVTKNDMER